MALVYTSFGTDQLAALTDGSERPTLTLNGGSLHLVDVSKTSYTAATADPLYLVRLPKGARVIPQLCSVDHGDPGDACTGTVGYIYDDGTGDADGYATAIALGGSAGSEPFSTTAGAASLTPVTLAADAWVYVTWGTVTNGASHTQTWHIAYTNAE
jgi:hypothetical protein